MWNNIRFGLAAGLMFLSLFTLCTGVLGVFRFRDTLQRMHAAAVNDTLGLLLAICSLVLAQGADFTSLKLILVVVFLWVASPVSSHLIAQLEVRSRRAEKEAKR
ncbi:MAG: monovalent cation/H(+) antiporter subunit G [Clostridia bacterium]|nr:monovalent cation/H(+) antiporter subunit G [Clostridia bacterium]